MTTSQLQEWIHAQPFRPFVIQMADGRTYAIPHPDFISHRPGGRVTWVWKDTDHGALLDLLLMTALEHMPAGSVAQPEGGSVATQ